MPPKREIDLAQLATGIRTIATRHDTTFDSLVGKRSALLEYAALLLAVERYAADGYGVTAYNLVGDGLFKVKRSSQGDPWNFSWYEVQRGPLSFELHVNAKTQGDSFTDDAGTYVVDVAVLTGGSVARARADGKPFPGFRNADMKTFIESKSLKIYPMLPAQFIGIVQEVKPRFVTRGRRRPRGHIAAGHFDPCLVALGSFSSNAKGVRENYPAKGYRVNVVPRFDAEAARGTLGDCAQQLQPPLP